MAPPYLSRDFHWTDEAESLQRLRSGSQPRLIVPRTRLRTIGDRCFRVMAARAWNSSDVNKDLTLKAKAKDSTFKAKANAKDRTFEGLNRELDI